MSEIDDIDFEECKKAAEQGNPFAQQKLGYIYWHGTEEIQTDYEKAFSLYLSAYDGIKEVAEQENADTLAYFANMYEDASAIAYWDEHNYKMATELGKKAIELYEKAVEKGYTEKACNIGEICTILGEKEKTYEKSMYWYTKAIYWYEKYIPVLRNENPFPLISMHFLLDDLIEIKAYQYVLQFGEKLSDAGDGYAPAHLGGMYQGCEKNLEKAKEYYEMAKKNGFSIAEKLLEELKKEMGEN